MNRKVIGFGAAVTALGLTVALTSSPALAAVEDGTYGLWSATDMDDAPSGTIAFGDATVKSATFSNTVNSGDAGTYIDTVNNEGDWLAPSTPPGEIFGANGPSDIENFLMFDANDAANSVLTITFDSAVPANELALVFGDIDSTNFGEVAGADRITVEGTSADSAPLTSAELNGGVFNMCNVPVDEMPDNCYDTTETSVPTMSEPTATSVYFEANLDTSSDSGDDAWVNPTVSVKSLTVEWDSSDQGSSVRVYVAVKKHASLPNTGVDVTTGALSALVLGALGAVAVMATRRRNA